MSNGLVAGKVALVTGAGAGIGRASARAFAREGAQVAVCDINPETATATADLITADGGTCAPFTADIADERSVTRLITQVVEHFGRLDCAHNNAGVEDAMKPAHDLLSDEWDRVLGTDLRGTWLCMRQEISQMLRNGGGSIVNTASVLAEVSMPNVPAYTAAKHGTAGLTRSAAIDYATRGIRVNAVSPGAIRTELIDRTIASGQVSEADYNALHPMNRLGQPDEVAEAVVWLSSDRASFVTGHCLAVDGGFLAR
ncbi:SDR family NAD(P)-dependent oxidoreductase [Wenjunlia tyrosinilytica]|uniref:Short chain dehydrogenase n=1 Tax=Wenjunlia tyrosinilytica TaxID=1544741 RepID=A0A917ZV85_9ACTN|nr:SDR family oxidoreductase [Wenjunlia tyrosinilytica]GGO97191.1 short chain dehydrogenase [Wenjunlia tyrosinilytica]